MVTLLHLASIFPSIRVFSYQSVLRIRWSKYWSFSFGSVLQWIFRVDFLWDWLVWSPRCPRTLKSLLQHYSLKTSNRFKELDPVDRVPEELWTDVYNIVQEAVTRTIPKEKKCKKAKQLSKEALQITEKRKSERRKGKIYQLIAYFQRRAKRDNKTLLSEQRKTTFFSLAFA